MALSTSVWQALMQGRQAQAAPSPMKAEKPVPFFLKPPQPSMAQLQEEEMDDGDQGPMPAPQAMPNVDMSRMKPTSVTMPAPQMPADREYEEAVKRKIEERSGGVQGMEKQIEALKNKSYGMDQLDLSPLIALTDAWRGTNMAGSYKAPNEREKDQATAAKLQEAIMREKGVITDDMISMLRDKAQMKMAQDMGRQGRFDESLALRKEDNIRKDINKVTDEYQSAQQMLTTAEGAVRQGDTRTVSMIIASIARNVGEQKGALSDGDVARSLPPDVATSVAGLESYLGRNGKISPQLQVALLNLIQNARMKSNRIAQESVARRKAQYSAGSYGDIMGPGSVGDVIFQEAERGFTPQQPSAPPQGQGFMSPQDWLKQKRAPK